MPATPGLSAAAALAALRARFRTAGLEAPDLDARLLFRHATGLDSLALVRDPARPMAPGEAEALADLAARRLGGTPVGRLLGTREFWGLPFHLSAATLEPRPDSETLIDLALAALGERRTQRLRLLDLGTGTGCLLVALLSELPLAHGLGIDLEPLAAATATRNAAANGVGQRSLFAAGHWANAVSGPFDLVISNPPYIATDVIAGLSPEVLGHDPALALDGGTDGLGAYREIAADLPRLLAPGGYAVLEIGFDQAEQVPDILGAAGLDVLQIADDLGGRPRAVLARRINA